MIRDTLMAIGKAFKGTAKNVVKTAAEKAAKQSLKKRGRKLVKLLSKKGQNKFNKYRESVSQNHKRCCRMQRRNLKTFCKTKCRKNLLHLPP